MIDYTTDFITCSLVAALVGLNRVSAGTGWLGVSIPRPGEIASLNHDLYLSVAARSQF